MNLTIYKISSVTAQGRIISSGLSVLCSVYASLVGYSKDKRTPEKSETLLRTFIGSHSFRIVVLKYLYVRKLSK